jgi:lipoprotein-anchoring transpeptidase ErfK/SrfK
MPRLTTEAPGSLSRRTLLIGAAAAVTAGCMGPATGIHHHAYVGGPSPAAPAAPRNAEFAHLYRAVHSEPHPIPAVDVGRVERQFLRQRVAYDGSEGPGTIVVDPGSRFLYFVLENGEAMRYGVGVGREGFGWSGRATVGRKARWPTWTPPASMIRRQPELARYAGGMDGGANNPLGARALYLYQDGRDTLYRLHGTNEPWSIGRAMSSGCIRLFNQDIIDLYERTPTGTRVVVRSHGSAFTS